MKRTPMEEQFSTAVVYGNKLWAAAPELPSQRYSNVSYSSERTVECKPLFYSTTSLQPSFVCGFAAKFQYFG